MTKVTAVVVNHRSEDDLHHCLAALRKVRGADLDWVVVDNEPPGRDRSALLAAAAGAPIVEAGDNLGYAGGNNLGISWALERGADFVWLLNPDARPHRSALRHMLAGAEAHPDAGAIGARVVDGSIHPPVIQSEGGEIDMAHAARSVLLRRNEPARRWRGVGEPREVDFVPGVSLLLRRSAAEEVGPLPEKWFMYFEEADYQLLAKASGWRSVVVPKARVWHHSARTDGLPGEVFSYYFVRNRIHFGREHGDASVERSVADLEGFLDGWRRRIDRVDRDWRDRFDQLVEWAIADAAAGRWGRRPDVGT